MKVSSLILSILVVFCVAHFSTQQAYAAAQTLSGRVAYTGTSIGVVGITVEWIDGKGSLRHMNTDANGNFTFPSWQLFSDAQRGNECTNQMDFNLDGVNDGPQASRSSSAFGGTNSCAYGDGAYGCGEDNHTVRIIQPSTWQGGFSVNPSPGMNPDGVTPMSVVSPSTIGNIRVSNNTNSALNVGTFYYSLPRIAGKVTGPDGVTGVSGVRVNITGGAYAYTDANGYSFPEDTIPYGNYYDVSVVLPAGYSSVNTSGYNGDFNTTWSYTDNRDTVSTDTYYKTQRRFFSDCASLYQQYPAGRCNFKLQPAPTYTPVPTIPAPTQAPQPTPVPDPQGPVITSLQVQNAEGNIIAGRSRTSGRQVGQAGNKWNNPITITVNATRGSTDIGGLAVAMYGPGWIGQSSYGNIAALANQDPNQAILLRFAYPGGVGQYQVYVNGGWTTIQPGSSGIKVCSSTINYTITDAERNCTPDTSKYLLYTVTIDPNAPTHDSGNPTSASWQIKFDKNFGSQIMRSAADVYDEAGRTYYNGNL